MLPWNLLSSLVPCEWWYWSLGTYAINKIVKMKCELTVSVLPCCSSPLPTSLQGVGGRETRGARLPLSNFYWFLCIMPLFWVAFPQSYISPSNTLDKRERGHIYIHTYNAMQDILANMNVQFKFIWYHQIADVTITCCIMINLCKSVFDVNSLKWHSALKTYLLSRLSNYPESTTIQRWHKLLTRIRWLLSVKCFCC